MENKKELTYEILMQMFTETDKKISKTSEQIKEVSLLMKESKKTDRLIKANANIKQWKTKRGKLSLKIGKTSFFYLLNGVNFVIIFFCDL